VFYSLMLLHIALVLLCPFLTTGAGEYGISVPFVRKGMMTDYSCMPVGCPGLYHAVGHTTLHN
jgi:hypothetical protein